MKKSTLKPAAIIFSAFVIVVQSFGVDRPDFVPMVQIPSGTYFPLYKDEGKTAEVSVDSFLIDALPVTNRDFIAFTEENPKWNRRNIKPLFSDESYLKHWGEKSVTKEFSDFELATPVTNVSWFAARAYCSCKGKRLPTVAEWEYVAAASESKPNGRADPEFRNLILSWYSKPNSSTLKPIGSVKNYFGVFDIHGLIWEWVEDFNTLLVTGESRGDNDLDQQLYCGSASISAVDPMDYAGFMRYSFRSSLEARYTVGNLGFRCAKALEHDK